MTIGERIKALRRKNDLTQERLAEYLSVSSQAVSKWECGLACPDLALIGPLTKLLHVTADELLGLEQASQDERRAYFDAEYHQYWMKVDHAADLEIAKQAVTEYPGEYKYLEWLASVEWYVGYSFEYAETPKCTEYLESSIRHYQMIIEDCNDIEIRNRAISGIVWDYTTLKRYEEAKRYAEMYPMATETTRDELLARCLQGEELEEHRRNIAFKAFNAFCDTLHSMWDYSYMKNMRAMEIEETVIHTVIEDKNFLGFHWNLYFISMKRAINSAIENQYDDAVKHLCDARKYAIGFDKMFEAGITQYTSTLFEGVKVDVSNARNETGTYLDWFRETIAEKKEFDPIRETDRFKTILADAEAFERGE